ncbi:MAG TPA: hypothetical protein VGK21_08315 [Candidatus Angelobacter sp.]
MATKNAFICRDVLLPQERARRRPLPEWVDEIHASLDRARDGWANDLPGATTGVMACFNQAALLEVHFGRKHLAEGLCMRALSWLDGLIAQTGNIECYKNGFQPFVNLARLDRINGSWTEALSKLDVLRDGLNLHSIRLHHLAVADDVLRIILQDNKLLTILNNMCMIERLKTLLKAEMYDQVLDLAVEPSTGALLPQFLAEAQEVAFCCTGEFGLARRLVERYLHRAASADPTVFLFRFAEVLAASGEHGAALNALLKLKDIFVRSQAKLGSEPLTLMNRLTLLLRTSSLFSHLNAQEECRELAWLGYRAALQLDDVPLICEFLHLLARAGLQDIHGKNISTLVLETKERAWYGVAQAPRGPAEQAYAIHAVDKLFQSLIFFSDQMVIAVA